MHREGYRRGDQGLVSRLNDKLVGLRLALAVALIAVVLGVLLYSYIFLTSGAPPPFYVERNGSVLPKKVKRSGPWLVPIPPTKTRLETEPAQSPAAGSPPPEPPPLPTAAEEE